MHRARVLFLALGLILPFTLAAALLFLNQNREIEPRHILTWDCEYPVYKPETIMIYCGDGGAYISQISWESWSKDGASGTGEYYRNLCQPDCADGKIVHAPVKVRLSGLIEKNGKFYLRTLDMTSANGKDFAWGESGVIQWDVMEFSLRMDV